MFLPDNYQVPEAPSNYMKFKQGANRFRILSEAITGWEYWTTDNRPVRSEQPFKATPSDMRPDSNFKHFWAFVVWNYDATAIQILEITQATIQRNIKIKIDNRNGNFQNHDFIVTRTGEGLETEYDVDVTESGPLPETIQEAYEAINIDLTALYRGEDPFGSVPVAKEEPPLPEETPAPASDRPTFGTKVPQFKTKANAQH